MKTHSGPGGFHSGFFGRPLMLRGKEEDDRGGGGGDDDETDDKDFSEKFNKFFHKAMGEREKRFEQKLTKTFETSLGKRFDELKKIIAEPPPREGEPAPEQPKPGQPAPTKLSPEVEARLRQSERDSKEAKERADKWEAEAKAEKERTRINDEKSELGKMLQGKVRPAMYDMVLNHLHGKNIARDPESNNILWKDDDGSVVPLKEGVAAWAKSDVGKEFAPPREVKGTGSRGAQDAGDGVVPTKPGTMTAEGVGNMIFGGQ